MRPAKELLDNVRRFINHEPQPSVTLYIYPFEHPHPQTVPFDDHPPEGTHNNEFNGARDFFVPEGTVILSAAPGYIVDIVDGHTQFGPTPDFRDKLNYLTIFHPQSQEYSQYCHIQCGSFKYQKGDFVSQAVEIAKTGNSGQMDQPHLHFFVFKLTGTPPGFIGLKPKFITPRR